MRVVIAVTFGPIHDGHRALFKEALRCGDDGVVVGLTSDELATSTRERPVSSYEQRERAVKEELEAWEEWDRSVEIREIDDRYGMADEDPSLDAIVVSTETADAVPAINERRERHGPSPLEQIVVPLVEASDGRRISSTRIVNREIDEHGRALS